MYHPFVDSLASILAEYPFKFFNVGMLYFIFANDNGTLTYQNPLALFDVIIYFIVGLKKEPGAFFIFVLVT